jgi:hypothetical protein
VLRVSVERRPAARAHQRRDQPMGQVAFGCGQEIRA